MKSSSGIFLFALLWLAFLLAHIGAYANSPLVPTTGNFIKLIENKGQWQSNILFKASIPSGALFVEERQLTYVFVDKQAIHDYHHGKKISTGKAHSIVVKLDGAMSPSSVLKQNACTEYYNYFIGNDASKWASHCNAYGSIILKNIYNGIDLEIIGDGVKLKTNFIVSPYANPNQIKLKYLGQEDIKLEEGNLVYTTSLGYIQEQKPISLQENEIIKTHYVLQQNTLQFAVNEYDHTHELVIDPQIIFGTYVGSVADNFGNTAAYDNLGNSYAGGSVYDIGFPVTIGAYDMTFNGGNGANNEYARDAVIVKFNSTGSQMMYSTYLGGTHNEQPHSMVVNANGELAILGSTMSSDFPSTSKAFDKTHNGKYDIFICKLSNDGTRLNASTFVGGSEDDGISGNDDYDYNTNLSKLNHNYSDWYRGEIFYDMLENVVVASTSRSGSNFPLLNPFQATFGGKQDGVIFKMNDSLTQLQFSSYFGGSGDDAAYAFCFDKVNNIYLTGGTESNNLPLKQNTYFGAIDGFIAKIDGSGALVKSIYLGTNLYDQSYLIQCDKDNNIYAYGQTLGTITPSAGVYKNTGAKQFIKVFDKNLGAVIRQTVFGANTSYPQLSPTAFVVDECSRLYLAGWGGGTNTNRGSPTSMTAGMPITSDAFQKTTDGSDFYIMVITNNLDRLVYASYIGGNQSQDHVDGGTSHLDKNFVIYQTVCASCNTGSSDFPTTPNAYSRVNPSVRTFNKNLPGCNIAVFKFDLNTYKIPPKFRDTTFYLLATDTLRFKLMITDANQNNVDFTYSGSLTTNGVNPAIVSNIIKAPGLTTADLYWETTCNDVGKDTFELRIDMINDACPIPLEGFGKIKVVVTAPTLPEANTFCLADINANMVELKWDTTRGLRIFEEFRILRSKSNGPMIEYAKECSQSKTYFVDSFATNHISNNYCYTVYSTNYCKLHSDTSRNICSIVYADSANKIFIRSKNEMFTIGPNDTLVISDSIIHFDNKDSVFISLTSDEIINPDFSYSLQNDKGKAYYKILLPLNCKYALFDTITFTLDLVNNRCPRPNSGKKIIKVVPIPYIPDYDMHLACPKIYSNNSVDITLRNKKDDNHFQSYSIVELYPDNSSKEIKRFSSSNNDSILTLNSTSLIQNENVCFMLFPIDVCGNLGDTLSKVCTLDAASSPPNSVEFYSVSVVNDKAVKLTWLKQQDTNFWQYRIFKHTRFVETNMLPIQVFSSNTDTTYTDENVKVDENSYCYEVRSANQCGINSIVNNKSCSILLKGVSIPLKHDIDWTNYLYWQNGVRKYEIIRTEPFYSQLDSVLTSTSFKQERYTDEKWNYDNGVYDYKIRAIEGVGGNNAFSESNTIELIQSPIVYVPNAYTPNGDNINDLWKAVPVFVKDFNLKLYNRWGEKIWETNDKKEFYSNKFSDKFSENEVALNVFVYVITYSGWDGTVGTKTGNVTLLR